MRPRCVFHAVGALLVGAATLAGPAMLSAQTDDSGKEFGAYVYETSCDDLTPEAVLEDLGDVELEEDNDDFDQYWAVLGNGQDSPDKLFAEDEDISSLTIDDAVASPHAIALHETHSKDADVIACSDITGVPEEGTLVVVLEEVEASGYEGRAYLAPSTDNDDQLQIVVGLWEAGAVVPLGTPMATPGT